MTQFTQPGIQYSPRSFQDMALFHVVSLAVSFGMIFICAFFGVCVFISADESPDSPVTGLLCLLMIGSFFIMGVFLVIYAVSFFVLIYRCWEIIQEGTARTTPGMAVGLLFIPFFNLYWMFVAIHGLAEDMNIYCETYGIEPEYRIDTVLSIITCISFLIPYINSLSPIPLAVLMISFGKAAGRIQERRQGCF